jgi:hypothetical protein
MTPPAAQPPTDPQAPADAGAPAVHLNRWTVSSGSNVRNRGAVVIASGDHAWDAVAEGNGPVDALYRAVDKALAGVLSGHPRLTAYDIHAMAEGAGAEAVVAVEIAPPDGATGARASGRYAGRATSTNIIAASIEAYLEAINGLLAEEHWAGATEQAGNRRRAKAAAAAGKHRRAEFDEDKGHHDTTAWFER